MIKKKKINEIGHMIHRNFLLQSILEAKERQRKKIVHIVNESKKKEVIGKRHFPSRMLS